MQPQIPMQRPVSPPKGSIGPLGQLDISKFPKSAATPKGSPRQSEADAGDMSAYGKSMGVKPVTPKPVLRSTTQRAPVKVDVKGNIMNQGGRPRASRGSSDGAMRINGRK